MSLINQMLRDLDEREALHERDGVVEIFPTQHRPEPEQDHRRWLIPSAIILVLIIATVALLWPDRRSVQSPLSGESPLVSGVEEASSAAPEGAAQAIPAETITPPESSPLESADNRSSAPGEGVSAHPLVAEHDRPIYSLNLRERIETIRMRNTAMLSVLTTETVPSLQQQNDTPPIRESAVAAQAASASVGISQGDDPAAHDTNLVVEPLSSLEQARRYLNRGQVTEARELLQQSLRENPGDLEARELLLLVLQKLNQQDSLSNHLDQSLARFPGHRGFIVAQARLLLQQGEYEQVIRRLEQLPEERPGDPTLLSLLAGAYQQQQRYSEAERTYLEIVELDPINARAWMGLAVNRDALGRLEGAVNAYKRAVSLPGLSRQLAQYAKDRLTKLEIGN